MVKLKEYYVVSGASGLFMVTLTLNVNNIQKLYDMSLSELGVYSNLAISEGSPNAVTIEPDIAYLSH